MPFEFVQLLIYAVVLLAVVSVVFLIFREVNCWYWKINRNIELQMEQKKLLERLVQHFDAEYKGKSQNERAVGVDARSEEGKSTARSPLSKFRSR